IDQQVRGISLELGDSAGISSFQITNNNQNEIFAIDSAGNLNIEGAINSKMNVVAETFSVVEDEHGDLPESGDVVIMSSALDNTLVKANDIYQNSVVGVVTDDSAITLNSSMVGRKVALAGSVEIKVTSLNGVINVGDYLTTSALNGYAMKATIAGPVVAKALESFVGENGTIRAFVHISWYDPIADDLVVAQNFTVGGDTVLQGGVILGNATEDLIDVKGTFASSLIASEDNIYDLGTTDNRWRTGYFAASVQVSDMSLTNNQITTTNDLTIHASDGGLTLQTDAANSAITLKPANSNSYLEVTSTDDLTTLVAKNGVLRVGLGEQPSFVNDENDLFVTDDVEIGGNLYVEGEILSPQLAAAIKRQIKNNLNIVDETIYWQDLEQTTLLNTISDSHDSTLLAGGNLLVAFNDTEDENSGQYIVYDNIGNEVNAGTFNPGNTTEIITIALANGRAVIAYTDHSNSDYGTFVVLNGAGEIIADEKVFNSALTSDIAITELDNNNLFFAYNDNGTGKYAVVSQGNTIIHSETEFSSANINNINLAVNGQVFLTYIENNIAKVAIVDTNDYSQLVDSLEVSSSKLLVNSLANNTITIANYDGNNSTLFSIDHNGQINSQQTINNVEVLAINSTIADQQVIVYQSDNNTYYQIFNAQNDAIGEAVLVSEDSITDINITIDQIGKSIITYLTSAGIRAAYFDVALGFSAVDNNLSWFDLDINASTNDQIVIAALSDQGISYSTPINIYQGDNTIDLGFITYEFTSVAGDNYIYLPGYGLGVKDIRSITDQMGRVYEANRISQFIYIIPDMGTDLTVAVEYTANIDAQAMAIIGNINANDLAVSSAATLSSDQASELVSTQFANNNIITAYTEGNTAKYIINDSQGEVLKIGIINNSATDNLAIAYLQNDDVMVAFRDLNSGQGRLVTINQAGIMTDQHIFATDYNDHLAITALNDDSVVIAYQNNTLGKGSLAKVNYQGQIINEITFNNTNIGALDITTMINGQILIAFADTTGRLLTIDAELNMIDAQVFSNFAPNQIAIVALDDNSNMITYLDGGNGQAKYVIYDNGLDSLLGETTLNNSTSTDITISRLGSGQAMISTIVNGQVVTTIINSNGSMQIVNTAVASGSALTSTDQYIVYTENSLQIIKIQPFIISNGVNSINKVTFNYEDYGVGSRSATISDDFVGDMTNDNYGDIAENMTVRELSDENIQEVLAMTIEEFNTYQYNYCQIDDQASEQCSYNALPAAGEVVVADYLGAVMAVKSVKKNARNILGVVTTDPAMILKKNLEGRTIVLAGTTPVKVTLENGPIMKGDVLTTSSTPGYAMKATNSTAGTIGVALDTFNPVVSCEQIMQTDYRLELEMADEEYTEDQIQELLASLDMNICQTEAAFYGEISLLLSVNNPIITDSGSIITVIDSYQDSEVMDLTVIEYEELSNIAVTGEAIFGGKITVNNAEFKGNVVIAGKIKVAGDLELSGAITQDYWDASSGNIKIGDAVAIVGQNMVDQTWADDQGFRPSIGLAVEILDYQFIPEQQLHEYLLALGYGLDSEAPAEIKATTRLIKVASAGTVGGFTNLQAGARYYLASQADLETGNADLAESIELINQAEELTADINEQQITINRLLVDDYQEVSWQRSLSILPPMANTSQVQILGVARSATELLIMPSLDYYPVGSKDIYWQEIIEETNNVPIAPEINVTEQTNDDQVSVETEEEQIIVNDTGDQTQIDDVEAIEDIETIEIVDSEVEPVVMVEQVEPVIDIEVVIGE
ncbi:MAG: hypothetical protein ABH884_01535, partial [Candidatus Komeilibacteria bacterium]